jgi:hypothetical protein
MGKGDDFSFFGLSGGLPGAVRLIGKSGMRPDAVELVRCSAQRRHRDRRTQQNRRVDGPERALRRLAGRTLSLEGVQASAIVFADRPVRRAGYMRMPDLVAMWSTGTFAKDPPNATVSAFAADGSKLSDAVVELTSPRLVGDRLTFDVTVLEGGLDDAAGPASIFIDTVWFGAGGGDGVHYLGQSRTTGGETPAFDSKHDTRNPSGWPNPSPNGPAKRTAPQPPSDRPPLTAPPGTQ